MPIVGRISVLLPLSRENQSLNLLRLIPQNPHAMWFYNRFLELLIFPSVWVAAAIASLPLTFQFFAGLPPDWQPVFLCFWTALIPYNLDRIFDSYIQKIPDPKAQSYFRQPSIFLLLLVSIVATAFLLYHAPSSVLFVSCGGVVPLLYGTPLFPWRRHGKFQWYRLKDIPATKAWIVGGTITYAAVALSLAYAGEGVSSRVILSALFLFIFVVTNSHTFDLRDLHSDQVKGVTTLPLLVGVEKMKILLSILNVFVLALLAWGWATGLLPPQPEAIVATSVTLTYLWRIQPSSPRPIYSVLVDGCLFVPLLSHYWLAIFR